jgi:hypothetical protein
MKTIIKQLITIKSIPVLALALLLVLGTVLAGDGAKPAKKPAPSLTGTITYVFVGADDPPTVDDEGRLLCWDGEIHGDIEGVILWWFDMDCMVSTGNVSHYVARWEIYDLANNLLLAGDSAGTTTKPPEKDGIWRGNGIVTEAYGEFEDWIDRHVYEGGSVTWVIPGVLPLDGEGIFSIN